MFLFEADTDLFGAHDLDPRYDHPVIFNSFFVMHETTKY